MGEVFAAYDVVLEREVAVKLPRPDLARRPGFADAFRREARSTAALAHPSIVAVYDAGDDGGTPFLVMELVRGRSLRAVLRERGDVEPSTAAEICSQILAALEHAHAHGIVHLDLKPENVMLTPDGAAKVADFGLARAAAEGGDSTAPVFGTPGYVAPEALRGGPVDGRADLYAVGVIALELLGVSPGGANRPLQPIAASTSPSRGSSTFASWASTLADEDVTNRPRSAAAARQALERARDRDGGRAALGALVDARDHASSVPSPSAPTVRRATAPTRRGRRLRTAIAGLIAVVIAGLAIVGVGLLEGREATVPSVVGLRLARARAAMESAGLHARVRRVYSTSAPQGTVSRVAPHAGSTLQRGARTTLFVSLGAPPVPVPSVLGDTLTEADSALQSAGLRLGAVHHRYDETFGAGTVAAQGVPAGEDAPRGSPIDVTLSEGSRPFAMPDVVGSSSDAASARLEGLGLDVRTIDVSFLGFTGSTVVRQSPAAGSPVQTGDVVRLYLD
jgi:serine/threonine-protein kinase